MSKNLAIDSSGWPPGWCPVDHAIGLLEGRWTAPILRELFRDGSCRFARKILGRKPDFAGKRNTESSPINRTRYDRVERLERAERSSGEPILLFPACPESAILILRPFLPRAAAEENDP